MNKMRLKDICLITSSKRIFEKEYVSEGIPFIRGQEITDRSLLKSNIKFECYISKKRFEEIKEKYIIPKKHDILITAVGTIGNVCYLDKDVEFYFKDGNILHLTNFNEKIYPLYLYYYMKSDFFHKQINVSMIGAVQKALTIKMLSDILIEIPSLNEQKKIATILSVIDKKIELNNKINDELEAMAKTIYDYWFLQFEFPNEEGKPYKSSGGKMIWNEELKREIPEGWEVVTLEDFGSLGNGINYDKKISGDKEYKIVNVKNISDTTLLLNKEKLDKIYLPPELADKYRIDTNDIIIARSGIPGAIRVLKIDTIENIIYCGFIICLRLDDELYRNYLVYKLKDYENTKATTSGGTVMQNVNQQTLRQIKFPVPNEASIKTFNKKIDIIWNCIQKNINENQELTSLRDFLLPLLMNGQVGFKGDKAEG